jgi:probable F420-dependent oxidoreductase
LEVFVVLPTFGPGCSAQEVIRLALTAEELGFDGVASTDHLLIPTGPAGEPDRYEEVFDVLMVLASVATITQRVKLLTSVVVLAMRNPFVVAKQAATLDQFSNGRLILGLGAGYNQAEFKNVGAEYSERGRRLNESLRLFRHLFAGSPGPFDGSFYAYDRATFGPVPVRGAALPILIGGNSDAALRRAAKYGDYWQSNAYVTAEQFPERRRRLTELSVGRSVRAGARIHVTGDPTEMQQKTEAYAQAGAEHLTIEFYPFSDLDEHLRAFASRALRSAKDN